MRNQASIICRLSSLSEWRNGENKIFVLVVIFHVQATQTIWEIFNHDTVKNIWEEYAIKLIDIKSTSVSTFISCNSYFSRLNLRCKSRSRQNARATSDKLSCRWPLVQWTGPHPVLIESASPAVIISNNNHERTYIRARLQIMDLMLLCNQRSKKYVQFVL